MTSPACRHWITAAVAWILLAACPASGQEGTAGQAATARVVAPASSEPGRAVALGDRITLTVQGLPGLLAAAGNDCRNLVLYLDGIAIAGSPAESCEPADGEVRFRLDITPASDTAWHALLGKPTGFHREVSASVGTAGGFAVPSDLTILLAVLPELDFYLFLLLFLASAVVFAQLARKTDILRNPNADAGDRPKPYSLARFQMALWFFLAVAAYVFMWMITAELDTITTSVLALIGISSGTALGSTLIDGGKKQQGNAQSAPPEPQAPLAGAPAPEAVSPVRGASSGSFLTDVLTDAGGINLQRFQMFAWTIVLGSIFCASVYQTLAMPQFSATLLGLMGVSSGTFLTFKFPEQFSAPPAPAGDPATADTAGRAAGG